MEIQKIIEELKLKVDKLPKEANWFGNVDHIRQLIKDLEQAFCQAGVSRSTFFTTDDRLSDERHREEAERLRDLLIREGFTSCGIGNAEQIWYEYSDDLFAGWLGMPYDDDRLLKAVQPYIRKSVYCG